MEMKLVTGSRGRMPENFEERSLNKSVSKAMETLSFPSVCQTINATSSLFLIRIEMVFAVSMEPALILSDGMIR